MTVLRWLKRLLVLIVVLAAVVLFGGPIFLSSDFGRTRVEAALARGLGRDVAIGALDVGMFFRSLSASDVSMGHPQGFGKGDTVAIRSMQIECGLRDLFDGKVKGRVVGTGVDIEVLKKGDRTTLEGLGGKKERPEEERKAPPLDLEVDLEDCDFTYRDLDTKETTSFEGIAVHAHLGDEVTQKTGRIRVTMRELRREPVVVRDVEVGLRADGSVLAIDTARGTMGGGGLVTARGELSLKDGSAWAARLDADNVSLDRSLLPIVATFWPFAASAGGNLEGLLTAGFDLSGAGVTWSAIRPTLVGRGDIRLTRLRLPEQSVLGRVAHYIDQEGDTSLGLNDAGAEFRIAGGWVDFNRLSASGKQARYDLKGRVSLEGKLDLQIDLSPLAKYAGKDVMRLAERYPKEFVANVGGSTTAPALRLPNLEALLKKIAQDALGDKINKALDGIK